ncbi:MAG: hypothetical protein IJT50_14150 [Lentisphaeria bacterium]|nr:hypothetical protein [Lentisphaeria bacterium]
MSKCPYCNMEVSESAIEVEDGCCPECGAMISAPDLVMGDEDSEEDEELDYGEDQDEDIFGDLEDDEEFQRSDEFEDDEFAGLDEDEEFDDEEFEDEEEEEDF